MSWIATRKRVEQVGIYVTSLLNDCGILPDGAELKSWIKEQVAEIEPPPTKFEVDMVLSAMHQEGIKFYGEPESGEKFARLVQFAGSSLVPAGNVNGQ